MIDKINNKIGKKIMLPHAIKKVKQSLNKVDLYRYKNDYNEFDKRIKNLHNIHTGERCFIMGTGPSLNNTKINLIKDEILFGVNSLHNGFSKYNIMPKYYAITDHRALDLHCKKVLGYNTTLFLGAVSGETYVRNKEKYLAGNGNEPIVIRKLDRMWIWNKFSKDLLKGAYHGGTVVILAIQIAYHLGFKEVYLVGCDCNFEGEYHFDKTGEGIDEKWKKAHATEVFPQWLHSFGICKKAFEEDGRKIYNATVGGKLEIFERKDLGT